MVALIDKWYSIASSAPQYKLVERALHSMSRDDLYYDPFIQLDGHLRKSLTLLIEYDTVES